MQTPAALMHCCALLQLSRTEGVSCGPLPMAHFNGTCCMPMLHAHAHAHVLQLVMRARQEARSRQQAGQGQGQHSSAPLKQVTEATCSMLSLAMTMLDSADARVAQHLGTLGVPQQAADLLLMVAGACSSPAGLTVAPLSRILEDQVGQLALAAVSRWSTPESPLEFVSLPAVSLMAAGTQHRSA